MEEGFEVQGDDSCGEKHGGPEKARRWKLEPLLSNVEIVHMQPFEDFKEGKKVTKLLYLFQILYLRREFYDAWIHS